VERVKPWTNHAGFRANGFPAEILVGENCAAVLAGAGIVAGAIVTKGIMVRRFGSDTKTPPGGGTASRGHH